MFSFTQQKKTSEILPHIRRLCDLTTPNLAHAEDERSDERFNRAIPTLLCPWEGKKPCVEEAALVLTSDLADHGVRLLLSQPFRAEDVVLGYWLGGGQMPEPTYFRGQVRRNQPIGGGFWAIGVELTEYASRDYHEELKNLRSVAERLLPPEPVLI